MRASTQHLAILYEMALLTGSEVSFSPLVKKVLQRLLYHTGFSSGLFLTAVKGLNSYNKCNPAKVNNYIVECVIGRKALRAYHGQCITISNELDSGVSALIEDKALLDSAFNDIEHEVGLYLLVPDVGFFLLFSKSLPDTDFPLTQVFTPVLKNLSRTLRVILENEIKNKEVIDSRNMLLAVLDAIPVRVFWKDVEGQLLGCNDLFLHDAGLEKTTNIKELCCDDMPWHEHAVEFDASTRQAYESMGLVQDVEQTIPVASGEKITISMSSVPMIDSAGDFIGVLTAYDNITNRKLMEGELIQSRELAEEASRAKSEFLSSMSHELRTPMNAVLGFAQLLQANLDGNLSERELIEVGEIIKGGSHLLGLINQVLDLARVEAGKIDVSMESVKLVDLMMECFSLIKPLADKRSLDFEINADAVKNLEVYADYMRLKQVMLNLLSNAVKYNKDHGSIVISYTETENGYLRISVTDSGPGLSESQLRKLFQPFQRLDAEYSAVEGTGIGLVLSKNLVELMKGRIGVECEVSKGCIFWIELRAYKA